jgi:protein SCO1/2
MAPGSWLAVTLALSSWGCSEKAGPSHPTAPLMRVREDDADSPGRIVPVNLVDQDGHPFGTPELRGHYWVVALMFSSCPMACPGVAERMAYLQRVLPKEVPSIRFLSVTLDPENDNPAVLAAYGRRFQRDPSRWTFVTGNTQPISRALTEGYSRATGAAANFDHGSTFALVDEYGKVIGYYGKDDDGIARLVSAANHPVRIAAR